ncbi:hypothetical protein PARPLA_00205 [Rhodobacteraceae bacterium THAF1]|nr:hypothetical protein [Palleronia sp. THAF1]QFU10230.1 hypothetical protein FIU81_16235 [Palleronia sp. THAF1]VDC16865.1 hypothetical protein PARPLA_00205 [Rhodobacteraceae bacterium THAF1]
MADIISALFTQRTRDVVAKTTWETRAAAPRVTQAEIQTLFARELGVRA